MDDHLTTLQRVLGDATFVVKDYQRPYAWQERQLRELWEDLDLMGSGRHYAGTLVLRTEDEHVRTVSGQELPVQEVVDGQQRLTTCVILLEQVRRRLVELARTDPEGSDLPGCAEAAGDLDRLVWVTVDKTRRPRLTLAPELRSFFAENVLGTATPVGLEPIPGQQRLREAAAYFQARVGELTLGVDPATAFDRLLELKGRLCSRLSFLIYPVRSTAEIGVIFETLNARGRGLSQFELVKNHLLYLSRTVFTDEDDARGRDLAERINTAWKEIFQAMSGVDEDDTLLRAHWLATGSGSASGWNGAATVKNRFSRAAYVPGSGRLMPPSAPKTTGATDLATSLFDDVTDYVETLRRSAHFFRDLHAEGTYSEFTPQARTEARMWAAALRRSSGVGRFRPLLIAARLRDLGDGGDFYVRLLRLCETFCARIYVIAGYKANAREPFLHGLAHDLYLGRAKPEESLARLVATLWEWAPDRTLRANFAPGVEWYHRSGCTYVLYEYERHVRKDREVPGFEAFNRSPGKSIEHVLPQNPRPDGQWRKDFTDDEHKALLHCIGNLVLTFDNAAYSNHEYARKRGDPGRAGCYLGPAALTSERELAETYPQWTPSAVEHRRARLEEWVLTRWPASPPRDETLVWEEPAEDEIADESVAPGA